MKILIEFVKTLNDSCGSLLLFAVALWALLYAKREYGGKNQPVFGLVPDLFYRGDGAFLTLKIENKSTGPINTIIEEVKLEDHEVLSDLKVSRFAVLHVHEIKSVFLKSWSLAEIERIRVLPGDSKQPHSVSLSIKVRSVSIEDPHKVFLTDLLFKIWFYPEATVATEINKYDARKQA